jgi:hypothetical protein
VDAHPLTIIIVNSITTKGSSSPPCSNRKSCSNVRPRFCSGDGHQLSPPGGWSRRVRSPVLVIRWFCCTKILILYWMIRRRMILAINQFSSVPFILLDPTRFEASTRAIQSNSMPRGSPSLISFFPFDCASAPLHCRPVLSHHTVPDPIAQQGQAAGGCARPLHGPPAAVVQS